MLFVEIVEYLTSIIIRRHIYTLWITTAKEQKNNNVQCNGRIECQDFSRLFSFSMIPYFTPASQQDTVCLSESLQCLFQETWATVHTAYAMYDELLVELRKAGTFGVLFCKANDFSGTY